MVKTTCYVHTAVYNYSHKYRNLDRIRSDVKQFLKEYDQITLHKDVYRRIFHWNLREIRDMAKQLLIKFEAAPFEDARTKSDKLIFCCGLGFDNAADLRSHYKAVHNEPFVRYMNTLELKSAMAKINHMRHLFKEYITFGEKYSFDLIMDLKKMMKMITNTLKF
ncbi:uncharacterized protein LOC129757114 [Uranotaenia lowii]|uniref:uncharacterized protein LOC129757114 n=1 Tax=Uranotaenia lowii TaxID=190385 RepID=UPI0024798B59|nr:uncharacterized protein LOC129757114 [Uranotaenia lowii]